MVPLREFLQSQGRLQEASLILNFELGFQPNPARSQEACRSFLKACSSSAVGQNPVWYVESSARLHIARSLNGEGQIEQAANEFELAKNQFRQAPVPAAFNRTEINVRYRFLQSSVNLNPHHSLQKWVDFAGSLSETEDSLELSSAFEEAAAAAHDILESDTNDENRKRFWELQSLQESLLEKLGDAYTIYLYRTTRAHLASVNYNGGGDILKWHRDFQQKHPNFCIWDLKVKNLRWAIFIYQRLNDEINVIRMTKQISKLNEQRDTFWSQVDERYTPQIEMDQDQVSDLGDEERTNAAFGLTSLRRMCHSNWDKEISIGVGIFKRGIMKEGKTYVERGNARLEILLHWLISGASIGELSKGDLERILLPTCESLSTGSRIQSFNGVFVKRRAAESEEEEAEVVDLLAKLDSESLETQLFGPYECAPSSAHWQDVFSALRNWLFQRARYNETKRHTLLLGLQTQMYWKVNDKGSLEQQGLEAQRILDLIPTLCTEAQKGQSMGAWRNIICQIKMLALRTEENIEARFEDHPKFGEITNLFEITLSEAQMRGEIFMQAITSASLASHYSFAAWNRRPGATEKFFRYCNLAEQSCQRLRESWKLLQGWEKVDNLLKAVEESFRYHIAASNVIIISRFPDSARVERDNRIWTAVQKEKSWGLGWLMQTNSLQGTEEDPTEASATSESHALPVITIDDLQSIGSHTESGVVYVDWYDGRKNTLGPNYLSNVLLLTAADGESPKIWQLEITWAEVDVAVKRFLECDEGELLNGDASKLLRELYPLVQPLRHVSKPGQVLVFSAVGDLHCIPLHALEIDNEFLIRRNPIVYCSSMTVLNVVFRERKKYEEKAKNDGRRFGFCLCLEEVPSYEGRASQASLVQMFAMKGFNENPLKDDLFTSAEFEKALRRTDLDLLHYHGHANFDEKNPKDQSLAFKGNDSNLKDFNLRDVFNLAPLPISYHATLLGCGSGKSKTTTSNEVLGLVSAFLYSGASSTVSALWKKIDDTDAAMYSEHFYSHFEHALEINDSPRVINLATANQKAVLTILEKRPELYHWAPFVLNGYWMYRIPSPKPIRQTRSASFDVRPVTLMR